MLPSRNFVLSKRTAFFAVLIGLSVMLGILWAESTHSHKKELFMKEKRDGLLTLTERLAGEKRRYSDALEQFSERLDQWKSDFNMETSSKVSQVHTQADKLVASMRNMETLLTEQEIALDEKEDTLTFHEMRYSEEDSLRRTMLNYIVALAKQLTRRGQPLPAGLAQKQYFIDVTAPAPPGAGGDGAAADASLRGAAGAA